MIEVSIQSLCSTAHENLIIHFNEMVMRPDFFKYLPI